MFSLQNVSLKFKRPAWSSALRTSARAVALTRAQSLNHARIAADDWVSVTATHTAPFTIFKWAHRED